MSDVIEVTDRSVIVSFQFKGYGTSQKKYIIDEMAKALKKIQNDSELNYFTDLTAQVEEPK